MKDLDFIEIELKEKNDFLKVRETLTRIGIPSRKNERTLYQSCHILHKKGKYYLVHFKELFKLDNKESSFTEEDERRRNSIALLLEDWGLIKIKDVYKIKNDKINLKEIKVVPYKEKHLWTFVPKYHLGKNKRPSYNQ